MKWIVTATLIVLSTPVLALTIYKPARTLVPAVFGVQCAQALCVDDPGRRKHAAGLVTEAKRQLRREHGLSVGNPPIIVCYTEACQHTFGLGRRAGMTLGSFAVVLAPRGIARHYVAHELIHYWQARNFGILVLWRADPWVTEGMAYALSGDPRDELAPPFEAYRKRFLRWRNQHAGMPMEQVVAQALHQN